MSLEDIHQHIVHHPTNDWASKLGYKPLYSVSATAKIAIIGQAPGRVAQTTGVPWNDNSGDILRIWLGLSKEEFYNDAITALIPMDFYYPGKGKSGDLPPRSDFAPLWHPQIFAEMPEIQLTVLIGAYAQSYYLGRKKKTNLTETVRSYKEYLPRHLPLVHPSPLNFRWQAKNGWFKEQVLPELPELVRSVIC